MRLFDEPPQRRRIAAYSNYEYPVASDQQTYELLDAMADDLDGCWQSVYSIVADPLEVPDSMRHRLGTGCLVTPNTELQCNDVEHLRTTLPDRFNDITGQLAGLMRMSAPSLIAHREMQSSCSGARWLRAWQPDLLVSIGLTQHALQSIVAGHLLDVPRLLVLDAPLTDTPLLLMLPFYANGAQWILVADDAARTELLKHVGPNIRAKVFVGGANRKLPRDLIASIAARCDLQRTNDHPTLGPKGALRTTPPSPRQDSCAAKPFLVLGAERTGSNLLVKMLANQAQMRMANELFNPRLIEANVMPWHGPDDYDASELLRMRHARPQQLFETLRQQAHAQSTTYAGFKLLYFHGLADDRVTDMLLDHGDLRIVHLLRENQLERFVSFARAQASDKWLASTNERPTAHAKVQIDLREMLMSFVQTAQFEARYRAMFQDHEVLEVEYRELQYDLRACLSRLGDWLSLDLTSLTPRSLKTGPLDVRAGIANWQEVAQALRGTCWDHFVEVRT